jgi:hypothetical protein
MSIAIQDWYAEITAQRFKVAGAIRRMMQRQLSAAWEKWQDTRTNSTHRQH